MPPTSRRKPKSATPTRKASAKSSLPAFSGSTCTTCASRWRRPDSSTWTTPRTREALRRFGRVAMNVPRLRTVLGEHPHVQAFKKGEIRSDLVEFEFINYSPTNTAFKPMVREQKFDVCEMAIV